MTMEGHTRLSNRNNSSSSRSAVLRFRKEASGVCLLRSLGTPSCPTEKNPPLPLQSAFPPLCGQEKKSGEERGFVSVRGNLEEKTGEKTNIYLFPRRLPDAPFILLCAKPSVVARWLGGNRRGKQAAFNIRDETAE